MGATWRTRYYAVRAQRLLEEHQASKIVLTYCPTKLMVADTLTKLATADVIGVLLAAMDSQLPTRTMANRTSVTPGPANRGDIAGDGPARGYTWADIPAGIPHPGLAEGDPKWRMVLEDMYHRWSSPQVIAKVPGICDKHRDSMHLLYAAFVQHHRLTPEDLQGVFSRTSPYHPHPRPHPLPHTWTRR